MSQAQQADINEFPEEKHERGNGIGDLPPSSDKKFWGENADVNLINKNDIPRITPNCGNFKQQGPFVICGTCPHSHTIPGFTLNRYGKLVKLDKRSVLTQ